MQRGKFQTGQQIGQELPLCGQLFQIGPRRGDNPDIGPDRIIRAHARDLVFLQQMQQRPLRGQSQGLHRVQKQRSEIRLFKDALARLGSAEERPFLVAAQFGILTLRGQRAAVTDEKGHVAARAAGMDAECQALLAHARLTAQQYGRAPLRHMSRPLEDMPHDLGLGNQRGANPPSVRGVFVRSPSPSGRRR